MKTIKTIFSLFFVLILSFAARAEILFDDASNYPYANGCIETDGMWYCYNLAAPVRDARVTNNVILLTTGNRDEIAAPTNGWSGVNTTEYNYASFMINVTKLPAVSGGYFCQFQNIKDTNDCCHVFADTQGTTVPGTYRLAVANFDTSFAALSPPANYPMDLAPGVWYNVVILYDTNGNSSVPGATLWVNPSLADYTNAIQDVFAGGDGQGVGYVYGFDTTLNPKLDNISISQIGFSPYVTAGISNVIAGNAFTDVLRTNPPVFGIQPQSGSNYSGNPLTLYAVASGADVTYQWYDNSGALSDNSNYTGSTNDILQVNDVASSDTFYCKATDAYGNVATSSNAVWTINTAATVVFFPTNEVPLTNASDEFTGTSFTNLAEGTGPIYYQWYFAPTNVPATYSALPNQNGPTLNFYLSDFTYAGTYYVVASNSVNGGSLAFGPTNTLVVLPALVLTMPQLHGLIQSYSNQIAVNLSGTVYVDTNNVTVAGYVEQFIGFGSTYSEYYIQDASGLGCQIFLQNANDNLGNQDVPPIGTYVKVTGQLETYHNEIELVPNDPTAVQIIPDAPPATISPILANGLFNQFVTNGVGTNAFWYNSSLVTFTNVYIYADKSGDPLNGAQFYPNGYTIEYFTVGGPYNPATGNTNMLTLYQFGYNQPDSPNNSVPSVFTGMTIPTNCFQLTGIYVDYNGTGEMEPSRPADYVTTAPAPFTLEISETNFLPTVSWQPQVGSTYSVNGAARIVGPWTQLATGLAYYSTNGAFIDTNAAPAKFYYITSP